MLDGLVVRAEHGQQDVPVLGGRRHVRGRSLEMERARRVNPPAPDAPDLRAALLALPPRQRAAIALHSLDDRPVAEIASLLGCSAGTVKTHLSRGREALAKLLREDVTDELR